MIVEFKYPNGIEVRNIVTGLTGIIDCSALWLNGCKRYSVQAKVKKGESTEPDGVWIDEQQLEKISDGIFKKINPTSAGGPSFSSKGAKF